MDTNANTNAVNNVWTSDERNDWIEHAVNSESDREYRRGYVFNTMLKLSDTGASDVEDTKRVFATSTLANAIYGQHPAVKRLSLCFYKSVMQKIQGNSFLNLMYNRRNFVVMMKGSNAYKILLRHVSHDIEHSDLDITVFINPQLTPDLFTQIHSSIVVLVSQVMCRYKKDLDACLFATNANAVDESILRADFVRQFKDKYSSALSNFQGKGGLGVFVSPFESVQVRNMCSKRSFMIVNSAVKNDNVVRIEVPHLDRCEFIPLKKTPLVLSHNKTITFHRDVEGYHKAEFELIRLRLNNLFKFNTEDRESVEVGNALDASSTDEDTSSVGSEPTPTRKTTIVPADFIDVSIPLQGDSELLEFWSTKGYNRCYEVFDKFVGANIMIPNMNECIRELSNMLHVYTSSHMKQEKRQKRLDLFTQLDVSRKEMWSEVPRPK